MASSQKRKCGLKYVIHSTGGPVRTGDNKTCKKRVLISQLADEQRNKLLFVMGVNNGLRAGDLLKIRVEDVRYLKPGEHIPIKEGKTGKRNVLMVNNSVYKALKEYLAVIRPGDKDYLFRSKKGVRPLTIQAVNLLIKRWTSTINLRGNFGAHTLRKTWGYIQRIKYGVGFEIICKRFNHTSPAVTMRYLGIEDKEVNNILLNEIG